MGKTLIAAVVVIGLGGCAGDANFIRQTPVISENGQKSYVLVNDMANNEWGRKHTLKGLAERSNKLCPSGYTLINEEIVHVGNFPTIHNMSTHTATWQIKCKDPV
jgi:hypothetical protein